MVMPKVRSTDNLNHSINYSQVDRKARVVSIKKAKNDENNLLEPVILQQRSTKMDKLLKLASKEKREQKLR